MKLINKLVIALAIVFTFISGSAKGIFGTLAHADTPEGAFDDSNLDQKNNEIASSFAKLYPEAARLLIQKAAQAPDASDAEMEHSGASCD